MNDSQIRLEALKLAVKVVNPSTYSLLNLLNNPNDRVVIDEEDVKGYRDQYAVFLIANLLTSYIKDGMKEEMNA